MTKEQLVVDNYSSTDSAQLYSIALGDNILRPERASVGELMFALKGIVGHKRFYLRKVTTRFNDESSYLIISNGQVLGVVNSSLFNEWNVVMRDDPMTLSYYFLLGLAK